MTLKVFKQFRGCRWIGQVFSSRMVLKSSPNIVWRSIYDKFRVSNIFFAYNVPLKTELFNFASTMPLNLGRWVHLTHQNLIWWCWQIWKTYERLWRGTWCPVTHVRTDHYRHARQVLWWLLRYLTYSKPIYKGGRPLAVPPLLWFPLFVLALNKVNIVAVTTILVLHVGNGLSEHVWSDITFLAIRASCFLAVQALRVCAQGGSGEPWPPGGRLGGLRPPRKQGGLGGRRPPNYVPRQIQNPNFNKVKFVAGCSHTSLIRWTVGMGGAFVWRLQLLLL